MKPVSREFLRTSVLGLAASIGLAMSAQAGDKMGYAVGFLTDPFQAVQADLVIAGAKAAGMDPLPVANWKFCW